ncbi:hypothetical protein PHET_07683 [Paragonimus heterotremus]|uniref:LIM zinc-binding domain-containing protein n=1 Tax=Paragonimus heterotremus TaxID=100268 RepID=A0A8J4WVV6_9TREM|nr:hypothetical protein PHET_07683 [Paragonimus heterotremus]
MLFIITVVSHVKNVHAFWPWMVITRTMALFIAEEILKSGDMVSVLDKYFHHRCFFCSACKSNFTPGIRVTYWENDYYCTVCFPKIYAKKGIKKLIEVADEVATVEKDQSAIRSNQMLPMDRNRRHRTGTNVTSNLSNQTSADLCSHFCQELSERLAVQYSACQKHISEGVSLESSKDGDQTDIHEQHVEVENTSVSKSDSRHITKQNKNNEMKSHEASRTTRDLPPSNQMSNTVAQLLGRYSPHPGSPSFRPAHTCKRSEFGAVPVQKVLQNGRVAAVVKRLEELSTLQLTVPVGNPIQSTQNEISKTTSHFTGCPRSLDRSGSIKRSDHQSNRPVRPDKCCDDLQTANVTSTIHQQTTEAYSQLPSSKSSRTFAIPRTDPQASNGTVGEIKAMVAPPKHSTFLSTSQLKSQSEASLAVSKTTPYPISRLTVRPLSTASLFDQPGHQSTPFTQANYPPSSCTTKDWSPGDHSLTYLPTSWSKVGQREYLKTQPPVSSKEQPLLDGMMEQQQSELVARLLKKTEVANLDVRTKDTVIEKSDLHGNLGAKITENSESTSCLTTCPRPQLTCPRKNLTALVQLRYGKSGQCRRKRPIQTIGKTVLKRRKKQHIMKSSSAFNFHSPLYSCLSIMQLLGRLFLSIICLVSLLSTLVWIAEKQTENYDSETDPLWKKAWLPKSSEDMFIANKLQM